MLRTSRVSSPLLSCLSCTVHPCLLLDNFLLKSFMNDGEFRQTACRCRKRGPVMPHFHGPFSVPSVRQGGGRGVSLDSPDLFFHSFRRVVLWLPLCPASAPPPLPPWSLLVPGMSPSVSLLSFCYPLDRNFPHFLSEFIGPVFLGAFARLFGFTGRRSVLGGPPSFPVCFTAGRLCVPACFLVL